jgi:endonuclease YncB( thermonuclease family)
MSQYIRGTYPSFSFSGRTLNIPAGQAVVYDPDTFFAAFPVEQTMYEHSFRVEGIDAIENKIKKADLALINDSQKTALFNRRAVALTLTQTLFAAHSSTVTMGKQDKYGRILSKVTIHLPNRDVDLAELLVRNKLVFPYTGETKMTLAQQADFCL